MEANKTILQMKYARIVSIFAEQTGITLEDALDFFYTSSIYQMMNEGIADMHCRSDGYLAELIKEEWKRKTRQHRSISAPTISAILQKGSQTFLSLKIFSLKGK